MQITLDNIKIDIHNNMTLQDLVNAWIATQTPFALTHNGQWVSQQDYANIRLQEEDKITCIVPMQGG